MTNVCIPQINTFGRYNCYHTSTQQQEVFYIIYEHCLDWIKDQRLRRFQGGFRTLELHAHKKQTHHQLPDGNDNED